MVRWFFVFLVEDHDVIVTGAMLLRAGLPHTVEGPFDAEGSWVYLGYVIVPCPDDEILALFRAGIRIKCHVNSINVTEDDECLLQAFAFLLQKLQYVTMGDGLVGNGQGDSQDLLVTQLGAVLEILGER